MKNTNNPQQQPGKRKATPPLWAVQLLEWYCKPDLLEEIQGDLQEEFGERVKEQGLRKAQLFYLLQVLRFLRPFTLQRKHSPSQPVLYLDLLRNYLTIAWRNLLRYKAFSLVNLFGLTMGMACCFLIFLFIQDELSYDKFHKNADRIYRVKYYANGSKLARTPPPLGPLLLDYFPEIAKTARLYKRSASLEAPDETKPGQMAEQYQEEKFYFADSTIFQIFSFKFIAGDSLKALDEPFSLVITEKMAHKYFGQDNPIGRTLIFERKQHFKVKGVIKDFPPHSHLRIDFLAPYNSMYALESQAIREDLPRNWVITHSFTYVLLHPHQNPQSVNARFPAFLAKHHPQQYVKDQLFSLQPLLDIHLRSDLSGAGDPEPGGSITNVYLFAAIGVLTLLIACINFINLSTARAIKRAREVGIRKVLGASRYQLIGQFLGESVLMSFMAFVCSLLLTWLLLPVLNELTDKTLSLQILTQGRLLVSFVAIFIGTGLFAGLYPAFLIAGFQPVFTLKANSGYRRAGGISLRKALIATQFIVSITLMACAFIIYRQLHYLQNRPLGFEKEYLITIPILSNNFNSLVFGDIDASLRSRLNTLEEALLTNPAIKSSTLSSQLPGKGAVRRGTQPEGFSRDQLIYVAGISVDYDFIKTYGLKVIAGRDFSADFGTDHLEAFIVNEKAVEQFNWKSPAEAIGKTIWREGKEGKVVGVIQDFHYQSLKEPINSFLLDIRPKLFTTLSVKIEAQQMAPTLTFIEQKWRKFFPEKVFEYSFLDETLAVQYQKEQRLGKVINYFSWLAILISCLGVYGLISFITEQRKIEIGIRKVLGASITHIVSLLSREIIILVILANFIAWPFSWWAMQQWLQNFTFRISLSPWMFVLAGLSALVIALLTASYQAIRAAIANPVKALRDE